MLFHTIQHVPPLILNIDSALFEEDILVLLVGRVEHEQRSQIFHGLYQL